MRWWMILLVAGGCATKTDLSPDDLNPDGTTDPSEGVTSTLELTSPAAGAWLSSGTHTVTGVAENVTELTLDGVGITASGGVSETVTLVPGIQAVELAAKDVDGIPQIRRHAVLVDGTGDPDGTLSEAIHARANRGGLDAMAEAVGVLFPAADVEAAMIAASPVYESWAVDMYITGFDYHGIAVALTPGDDGLVVGVLLTGVEIDLHFDTGIDFDETITIDAIDASGVALLSASGGVPVVQIEDVRVDIEGLDASLLPDFDWIEGIVAGLVEDTIVDLFQTTIPELVEEVLLSLDLGFDLDLLGVQFSVVGAFAELTTDNDGVLAILDVGVDAFDMGLHEGLGFVEAPAVDPELSLTAGVSVAIHDDLINALMLEAWRGGLLDQTLDSATSDLLPPDVLELLGADQASLSVSPDLPPVAMALDGQPWIQMGELIATIDAPGASFGDHLQVAVDGSVQAVPFVMDGELQLELGEPEVHVVVRDTDWVLPAAGIGTLLEQALPVADMVSLAEEFRFPLPAYAGLQVGSAVVVRDVGGSHALIMAELETD